VMVPVSLAGRDLTEDMGDGGAVLGDGSEAMSLVAVIDAVDAGIGSAAVASADSSEGPPLCRRDFLNIP
jgi:hypothetical protein